MFRVHVSCFNSCPRDLERSSGEEKGRGVDFLVGGGGNPPLQGAGQNSPKNRVEGRGEKGEKKSKGGKLIFFFSIFALGGW